MVATPKLRAAGVKQLTEMDLTMLGIIGKQGPLSAYDVRKVFASSLTPTWSSSTGSVYPASRRLIEAGLVTESKPQGARSRKRLRITPKGRRALEAWLTGLNADIAAPTPDPIRTRMYFLDILDRDLRRRLVRDAIVLTEQSIEDATRRLEERSKRGVDAWERLAAEGVLYELRARREWLRWLARRIETASA